jgi:hypothetical protein
MTGSPTTTRPGQPRSQPELAQPKPDTLIVVRHGLFILALTITWAWSLMGVNEGDLGDYGIVTILPIAAFVVIAGALAGFVASLMLEAGSRIQAAYVLGITVMLHGLPTFVYDHLRFSWAWKHVGIVEYIQRVGDVDPTIDSLGVYHNWPGFFGLSAWITEASQLQSALSYAAWAPILFNLLFVGALYMMFRALTRDSRMIWTALLIFVLGNWVGQDYFAPQAMAFFFYLAAMAILLRWYSRVPHGSGQTVVVPGDEIEPGSFSSFAISAVLALILLAIAATHQLTPIVTIAAIGGLLVFRVIRISWPLYAMIAFTLAWLFGPARTFVVDNITTVLRELGGFQANLDDTLVSYDIVNSAQLLISQVARLLSASVFALAGLGWLRRRQRRLRSGWVLLLAAVPGVLVIVSSYGGEIVFRAYLFGLPFAAFLAASLWFPDEYSGHSRWTPITLGVVVVALTAGLLVADFGTDNRQVFDDNEVAASDYVFERAQPGALIIEGSRDYPRQYRNYEKFTFLALDRSTPDTLEGLLADPAGKLASWVSDTERYNGGYVIITSSQRASVTELGTLLSPTLDAIENSLLESPLWTVVFQSGPARVFGLVEQQ